MVTIRIYQRVSSRGQSMASQTGDLERWAEYKRGEGCEVVWYEDTFTGKSLDRPGFKRLQRDLKSGDSVAVWRLDRLGRTTTGLLGLFEGWGKAGVGFFSLRDSFDLGTASGRLVLAIMASISAYETEVRAERVAAGRKGRPRKPSPFKGKRRTVTAEQAEAIVGGFKAHGNVSRCVRTVGLSRPTVYSVLREAGLTEARG